MGSTLNILWAIDPSDEESRFQEALSTMNYLLSVSPATIQPVCVKEASRPAASEGNSVPGGPLALSAADLDGQGVVLGLLKRIDPSRCLPLRVIEASSDSPHAAVDAVLSLGLSSGTDLIVANTHGWTGLSRILRGSFVDRLLARSHIPVLALGPELHGVRPFDRILFATHLNRFSNHVFRQVVALGALFRAHITVLHLLSRRERDQDADNSTVVGESLPKSSNLSRRTRAWSKWATKQNVEVEVVIEDCLTQVAPQILSSSLSHRVGLICLESRSGPTASVLKGSRVRELIRTADCPVWISRILHNGSQPRGSLKEDLKVA